MPDIASRDIFHLSRDISVRSERIRQQAAASLRLCAYARFAAMAFFPAVAKSFSHSVSSGSR